MKTVTIVYLLIAGVVSLSAAIGVNSAIIDVHCEKKATIYNNGVVVDTGIYLDCVKNGEGGFMPLYFKIR